MHRQITQGLAIIILVSLGAAPGPASTRSMDSVKTSVSLGPVKGIGPRNKPYEVGTASWYGDYFDGKETASGEPFNMYDLTAAHPSLPLGTYVRVTNLKNRKAVTVRINDRGPVVPGRIIDLSYSAAQVLHFQDKGLQRVRLDVVHPRVIASLTPAALTPVER